MPGIVNPLAVAGIRMKHHGLRKYTAATIAEWRRLMKENAWTQKELAEHLRVRPNTISKLFADDARGGLP